MADDNIILFPLDKIKNKANVGPKQTKFTERVAKEQTNKFVKQPLMKLPLNYYITL